VSGEFVDSRGQTETDTATDEANYFGSDASIDVEKYVSVDGGTTWSDADTPEDGLKLSIGISPRFKFVVTNTGNVALSNVDIVDSVYGDINLNGSLGVGESKTYYYDNAPWNEGPHTNTATATGEFIDSAFTIDRATDVDDANYYGLPPVEFTGNSQFNHPASAGSVQPKLQGGSITINAGGYIYWDFYTPNKGSVRIESATANYGLSVDFAEIWSSAPGVLSAGEAVYRIFVSNKSNAPVSLVASKNVVNYTVSPSNNGQVLDLIPSDAFIGSFNDYSNIKNALGQVYAGLTPSVSNFEIAPSSGGEVAGSVLNKFWLSSNITGGGIDEPSSSFVVLSGGAGDVVYGVNNISTSPDGIVGSVNNDLIDGRAGYDSLSGGDGNDYVYGAGGNDILDGGSGVDTVIGSYGSDTLTGGFGGDAFVVETGALDVITDFSSGADQLWFRRFTAGLPIQASQFIDLDNSSLPPSPGGNDLRFYYNAGLTYDGQIVGVPNSGDLYYDQDGMGSAFKPQFVARLEGSPVLVATDILI
jgi:Ca2+-binding RTX toxin-like protein